jgi:signal transduction histidine kinase
VLQNLCSNGVNYTPASGRVRLSAEVVDGAVKLSVQDSGIGIAPQDLPKIFNRFFQAENATKHRGGGFGLGLKIAREIVEAHAGRIEVTSVLGQGSTFFFTVPVLPS